MNKTTERIFTFKATMFAIRNMKELRDSVVESRIETKFYPEEEEIKIQEYISANKEGMVFVSPDDTITTALKYSVYRNDGKVGILNFANSLYPGGGVIRGARAQEESICRCSTLYPVLNTRENKKRYYTPNLEKINNAICVIPDAIDSYERCINACMGTSSIIYTPNIKIIKSQETITDFMNYFVPVDVITCAAPDFNYLFDYVDKREITKIVQGDPYKWYMRDRCERIFKVAAINNVSTLVLGAFGCGAFLNDPKTVATIFRDLVNKYRYYFSNIIFAVYGENSENFKIFRKIINFEE